MQSIARFASSFAILLALGGCLTAGCHPTEQSTDSSLSRGEVVDPGLDYTEPQECKRWSSNRDAGRWLDDLVPVGTPEQEAIAKLESEGYQSREDNGDLVFDKFEELHSYLSMHYRIVLAMRDGRVSELGSTYGTRGP